MDSEILCFSLINNVKSGLGPLFPLFGEGKAEACVIQGKFS